MLLHIFSKRPAKIPASEIKSAKERWDDFKERMGANQSTHSRAARNDAP